MARVRFAGDDHEYVIFEPITRASRAHNRYEPGKRRIGGNPTDKQRGDCNRKNPYARGEAIVIARAQAAITGEPIVPYRCPVCGRWHIGHQPGWRRALAEQEATA